MTRGSLRGVLSTAALAFGCLGLAACTDEPVRATPAPACSQDGGCITETAGQGSTGAGGGGGAGGAAAGVDVQGAIGVLTTASFDQAELYSGDATITAGKAGGGTATTSYGADAGTGFALTGLASGVNWFFVEPAATTSAFSTYSAALLPGTGALTLPIVDRAVVTTIAATLPTPVTIDDSAAQLVLLLSRQGAPLTGVQLTSTPGGAIAAFDLGAGVYSTDATATGAAGIILLFNATASNVETELTLSFVDAQATGSTAIVRIRASALTFARLAL